MSIDFAEKPLISSMDLAVPSARLAQACCLVSLPYYEGYSRFAVWPAPNSVSKLYQIKVHEFFTSINLFII